jgi:hypothetical protein
MKIILSISIDEKSLEEETGEKRTEEEIKDYLTGNLFEICEDWVINSNQPSLDFEGDDK